MITHQATGVLSVQLNVTLAEAQVVLRAATDADGGRLSNLAREVVERRRLFNPKPT